jgi:hypothetical protein
VQPPIRDRGYDKKLREILRLWRFSPARTAEGQAVPGVKTFTYTP